MTRMCFAPATLIKAIDPRRIARLPLDGRIGRRIVGELAWARHGKDAATKYRAFNVPNAPGISTADRCGHKIAAGLIHIKAHAAETA